MNKWIKMIAAAVVTIILGAIGSGLWERFLSEFFDVVVNLLIELLDSIFTSYQDGIYESASLGFREEHSIFIASMIYMFVPMSYYILLMRYYISRAKRRNNSELKIFVHSKNVYKFLWVMTISAVIFSLLVVTKKSYTNRVISYSLRSIDIVRPYISEKEHNLLLSQYYQIRSADDFEEFNQSVTELAELHSLRLPSRGPL